MLKKKRHVIHKAEDLLVLLRQQRNVHVLSQCEIKLNINLYEIIAENPIEGIELIEGLDQSTNTDLISAKITPGLYLTNLRFKKTFGIVDCLIKGPVIFNNVIFEEGLQFHYNELIGYLNFNQVVVNGEASFSSTRAHDKFSILKSVLPLGKPGFKYSVFEKEVFLFDTHFPNGLDLSSSHFKDKLEISHGHIRGLLNISDARVGRFVLAGAFRGDERILLNDVNLSDTAFEQQVQLHNITLTGTLRATRALFEKELYIDYSVFNGHVRFPAVTANGIVMIEHCKFEQDLSFSHGLLEKSVSFTNTVYNGSLWFTGAKVNDNMWIGAGLQAEEAVSFPGTLGFEASIISANSIVRIFRINTQETIKGKLHMQSALVKGLVDIRKVYIKEICLDGAVVTGNLQVSGTLAPYVTDWHGARLLKNEAKKINNNISALAYYRREMELHAKGLHFRQTGDWLLLKLNAWSNRYGTSWLTGAGFTIVTGFVFFYMFALSAHNFHFVQPDWPGFLQYFWLPNGLNGLVNINNTVNGGFVGGFFFLLGKILIAYVIYQTIAAFRKFL
ncbi:hypothetical protein [Mucilaginibacter segetis]|uniref:Uncharacterized protein n=1 Tax=Mucilaginibacter segetis TaxID=2793071 RepID=A0A934UM68_9SPHI|nr:hypothetical protein [Mucilaginibacter segetis]MBK0379328.1 hypothetical protein [Mucilaginibacter segetis]